MLVNAVGHQWELLCNNDIAPGVTTAVLLVIPVYRSIVVQVVRRAGLAVA